MLFFPPVFLQDDVLEDPSIDFRQALESVPEDEGRILIDQRVEQLRVRRPFLWILLARS